MKSVDGIPDLRGDSPRKVKWSRHAARGTRIPASFNPNT